MTQPDRAARGGRAHRPWTDIGARWPRLDAGAAASSGFAITSKNRGRQANSSHVTALARL